MATWRVNNSTLLGGEVCSQWQANHAYSLGARCVCTTAYATTARRGYVYECTTAGTSHGTTQPTWPTSGTVADGTVVWTTRNPNDGSWDNASCILHYVLNHGVTIAAGDTVYVDDGHSEAVLIGATSQYAIKGSTTKNNPIKIICVDKTDDSLSTGAVVYDQQTSGTYLTVFSNYLYSYGVAYRSKTLMQFTGSVVVLESDGSSPVLQIESGKYAGATNSGCTLVIVNAQVEFLAADAYLYLGGANVSPSIVWNGGSVVASSGVSDLLYGSGTSPNLKAIIRGVDLSAVGNNTLVSTSAGAHVVDVLFERCKLPETFDLTGDTLPGYNTTSRGVIRLHHCSSDNKTYDFYEECYAGTIQDEITIVRTGGASDGTTPISMKMVSSANTKEQFVWLESPPIHAWTTSAASQTVTVEFVHDSATALQNDEIWLEVEYPADNTSGLGAVATSRCAILGTPADTTDSSESWTTTGLTNPNTRKFAVTIDPGKVGPITARVCLAKASTTVYVDPMITIS